MPRPYILDKPPSTMGIRFADFSKVRNAATNEAVAHLIAERYFGKLHDFMKDNRKGILEGNPATLRKAPRLSLMMDDFAHIGMGITQAALFGAQGYGDPEFKLLLATGASIGLLMAYGGAKGLAHSSRAMKAVSPSKGRNTQDAIYSSLRKANASTLDDLTGWVKKQQELHSQCKAIGNQIARHHFNDYENALVKINELSLKKREIAEHLARIG